MAILDDAPPSTVPISSLEAEEPKLRIGNRLQVLKIIDGQQFYHHAEVMSIRHGEGASAEYYVHFTDFNKRLDEWVGVDKMDLSTIEPGNTERTAGRVPTGSKRAVKGVVEGSGRGRKKKAATLLTPAAAAATAAAEVPDRSPSVVSVGSSELNSTVGIDNVEGGLSKAQELEKLRRGGSMTQRPEEVARVKNIDRIEMGNYIVQTWYFSPYPAEICGTTGDSIIYLCEFCLFYFGSRTELGRHREKCTVYHPPGCEIYRSGKYSFWELDGHKQKTYCRNLCLLSKLFLDHKTLFYDVDPFLFYVLTENDERGCHILGYFSKEKESAENYNVACILTLPQHQRKGYGKLLIEFSYELTKLEGTVGSPEKPLSDLGLLSYRSFWTEAIVNTLMSLSRDLDDGGDSRFSISIEQLSKITGFTCDDILHTLQAMDALRYRKGQHVIVLSEKHIADHERLSKKNRHKIEPKCLQWTPPVFTASQLRFL